MREKDLFIEVGSKMRNLRRNAGYQSAKKFADANGLCHGSYERMESGKNMTLGSLARILSAHEMTIKEFFTTKIKANEQRSNSAR